jgi:hypothetical protein
MSPFLIVFDVWCVARSGAEAVSCGADLIEQIRPCRRDRAGSFTPVLSLSDLGFRGYDQYKYCGLYGKDDAQSYRGGGSGEKNNGHRSSDARKKRSDKGHSRTKPTAARCGSGAGGIHLRMICTHTACSRKKLNV